MFRLPLHKYPYTDYHELNLDFILQEINNMYTTIDTKIHEVVDPVASDLEATKVRVTSLEELTSSLNTRLTTAEGNITNINNSINTIEGNINTINTYINTIYEDISSIFSSISTINDTLSTHTSEIADIYERIADIDPTGSLYVNADNFDTVTRTISTLKDELEFNIIGGFKSGDRIYLQPDLIPGSENTYYPRVTMDFDPITDKVALPSELTTGDFPLILRGTYATNVNVDGETFVGSGLEYNIEGKEFNIDGKDDTAIILMCIWCLHHNPNGYENIYEQNNTTFISGMPFYETANDVYLQRFYQFNSILNLQGKNVYMYCFNKAGELLDIKLINDIESGNTYEIPLTTYSIWYGIHVPNYLAKENINDLSLGFDYSESGCYIIDNGILKTEHIVKFESDNDIKYYKASYNGIKIFGSLDRLDMITGKVYRDNVNIYTCVLNMSLNDLDPETTYTPSLPYKATGYSEANINYNKISLLLNGLDSNNVRY